MTTKKTKLSLLVLIALYTLQQMPGVGGDELHPQFVISKTAVTTWGNILAL